MDETDDAAHLQSMWEDFSDGELVEDLLPAPAPRPPPKSEVNANNSNVNNSNEEVDEPKPLKKSETTLYIGHLSLDITENLLEALFSEFGPIRSCQIIQPSATFRFAFLTYYEHNDANAARFTMDGKNYLGTKLVVNWKRRFAKKKNHDDKLFHVFVGDLDKDVDSNFLHEAFAPFGEISACTVVTDPDTSQSKGYGFVSYFKKVDAEMAIETMKGQWIKDKVIRTAWGAKKGRAFEKANGLFMKDIPQFERYIQCQQVFDRIFNQTSMSNRTIFVGGLFGSLLNTDMLNAGFAQFGCIEDIKLCNAPAPGKSAYAFIMYSTKESACNAIMCMHNKAVEDTHLKVAWGRDRSETDRDYDCGPPSFEYGQPIEEIQRTIQGYGCAPGVGHGPGPMVSSGPGPFQYPHPQLQLQPHQHQSIEPGMPIVPVPPMPLPFPAPEGIETQNQGPPPPTPEEEAGHHAFSYYGTYVYQEKVATENEDNMSSSSGSSSSCSRPRQASKIPSPPPKPQPLLPPGPKARLKSVAIIRTHKEIVPSAIKQKNSKMSCTIQSRSRSTKRKSRSKKRKERYSSSSSIGSSSSRNSSRSRPPSRNRRFRRSPDSRDRSRSPSRSRTCRSRSFSQRRSRPRSRSYDSPYSDRVRHRSVKSRVVGVTKRKKSKLPFILPPSHHPPAGQASAYNHNIHAINQSTIVTFPGPPSYQQQHYYPPATFQEGLQQNIYPAAPISSYGTPQPPTTYISPAGPAPTHQAPAPPQPQPHQYYVNPNFLSNNQLPLIRHQQEYNPNYTVPTNSQGTNSNFLPNGHTTTNYIYQQHQQQQFNDPNNMNYNNSQNHYQAQMPLCNNNLYQPQLHSSGPPFTNLTYYPNNKHEQY